jgi:TolA-binding protein
MKRIERHRLKENELSHVISGATARVGENRRTVGLIAGAVALVLVAGVAYWAWNARKENRAQVLMADAVLIMQAPVVDATSGAKPTPGSYPTIRARAEAALAKFNDVFNAYPSTDAGIAARYYAAAALAMLDRPAEAATRYQEVADRAGTNDFYGRMARLGLIEANLQAKKYDQAIGAAQALVSNTSDETIPRDALLMELGRVQVAAGKKADAKQTFDKVIAEFPESPYLEEAKQLLASVT